MSGKVGVVGLILAAYDHLPESEKRIADFILKDSAAVSTRTASDIARESRTSATSVSRFARNLGFNSFSELRLALARDEADKGPAYHGADRITPDDLPGSARFILDNKIAELNDTLASLDMDSLEHAVHAIAKARVVLMAGVGSSLSFAQMQCLKFNQVGITSVSPSSSDAALTLSLNLTAEDCVLFFSNSGASRRLDLIMDNAVDAGATTIAVTADGRSKLASRADVVLQASIRDQLMAEEFIFSHNSLNYITEILLLLVACGGAQQRIPPDVPPVILG